MYNTDKEYAAGNGIESNSNSRTSNTPGVSSVNTITNSVLDAKSIQSSTKSSIVDITNEAISANKNQRSTDITIYCAASAKTKSWPETITGDNSIFGIDSKTGLWVFCKFCDKRVASRAG